jgi:hypothetical protein
MDGSDSESSEVSESDETAHKIKCQGIEEEDILLRAEEAKKNKNLNSIELKKL